MVKKVFNLFASFFAMLAVVETSTASLIFVYQPELPKEE